MGLLQTMILDGNITAEIIPVDVTVNLMIAAAWFIAKKKPQEPVVFNNTSGQINKLTWGVLYKYAMDTYKLYPFENSIFTLFNSKFTTNK